MAELAIEPHADIADAAATVTVSIITPAFNGAHYLVETIESVLSQEYPNIEYIVLDDGSVDDTVTILQAYSDRLKFVSHSNMGEARTVNRGFELATGEILGVVSADDPLLAGAVSAAVESLQHNPNVLVVYPDWNMIDANSKVLKTVKTFDYSYQNMLRWHHCFPGPGAFFRRSVVERLHGRDPQFRFVADFEFWLRAGLLGPFARIPRTLASYRWHADSASSKDRGIVMADEHIRLIRTYYALPALPRPVTKIRREAISSAYWVAGVVVGDNARDARRKYFLQAIRWAPLKYVSEYRRRLFGMLFVIVPWLFRFRRGILNWASRLSGFTINS